MKILFKKARLSFTFKNDDVLLKLLYQSILFIIIIYLYVSKEVSFLNKKFPHLPRPLLVAAWS